METMNKNQTCMSQSTRKPGLAMHRGSRKILKAKPKIRIIHIFAPEIIKTDVANFRELVQRLTGKPSENECRKRGPRYETMAVKEEEEGMWSSGGFLCDLEGFIEDYSELPLLPVDGSLIHCFDVVCSSLMS